MATPRVFISSTFYDLRHIRQSLAYFVRTLGFDAVLSETGAVFYNPSMHTADACLVEVPNCQLFVLIIGGRYGSLTPSQDKSVTNAEYEAAVRAKVPIFALVEQSVLGDLSVYRANRDHPSQILSKLVFPATDDLRIFEFLEQVRGQSINNALFPFRDFSDIESYLRQQWSGMMFSFLSGQNERARIEDTLKLLTDMSKRIEVMSQQLVRSVGDEMANAALDLYDILLSSSCMRDLAFMSLKPTPAAVIRHSTFDECAASLGKGVFENEDGEEDDGHSLCGDGEHSPSRLRANRSEYTKLRQKLLDELVLRHLDADEFVSSTSRVMTATAKVADARQAASPLH